MTTHWPAPTAAAPVHAVVAVPGSKSITNRALVLAALADGPSTITGGLLARDTRLMIEALRGLGTGIDIQSTQWSVTPAPLRGPVAIDCGLAGTIMRFLPPAACLATGEVRLDGDPRARERPMAPLLAALQQVGADLISADGRLPVLIHGTGRLRGGQVDVDASASSQFISGLLLSAARFDAGIDLRTTGEVPSLPHIDMTVAMLADHGIAVAQETLAGGRRRWMVSHGPIRAADRPVEPDLSNALPFLAAAMVSGGSVTIPHWPAQTTQPGGDLPRLLRAMGGMCTLSEDGLTVAGPRRLSGLVTDLRDVGELTPVLAALAALADTPSRFTGIGHLRGHETDRLAALATELNALGGRVKQEPDGLLIEPAALRPGIFATYDDHRMATAAAVLGLVVPGVEVENVETTDKTLPDFLGMWTSMLAGAGR